MVLLLRPESTTQQALYLPSLAMGAKSDRAGAHSQPRALSRASWAWRASLSYVAAMLSSLPLHPAILRQAAPAVKTCPAVLCSHVMLSVY